MEAPYVAGMYHQKSLVIECEACSSKMWRSIVWTALDPLFLASPALIIKKPKLNQTKIKLEQEIKIKTSSKIKQKDMD